MSELLLPVKGPVCNNCHKAIRRETEPRGRLYLVKGNPVCTMCRLLHFPKAGKVNYKKVFSYSSESKRADIELEKLVANELKKENERVAKIALESVKAQN